MNILSLFRKERISTIGLGSMGLPITHNLIKSGYKVKVFNRNLDKTLDSKLKGSLPCKTPQEAAHEADILIICVKDENAVEDVLFGEKGAFNTLRAHSTVIDLSTINYKKAIEFSLKLNQKDINYIDAPVTGGTEGAVKATLTILVGGDKKVFDKNKHILEVIGSSINYLGAVGSGQKAKVINQILVAGTYAALAEAISLGECLDLPIELVLKALTGGAAGSWALKNRSSFMLSNDYPLGFKLSLHNKDLKLALEAARENDIDLPITKQVKQIEETLINRGYKDKDVSAIKLYYEK